MSRNLDLLKLAKSGDEGALNELCRRLLVPLKRWASGRLPTRARAILDTDDLVQETIVRCLEKIPVFDARHDSAFEGYLQKGLMNRIRDEIRKADVRPKRTSIDGQAVGPDGGPTAIDVLIGQDAEHLYAEALRLLKPADREAIVARVELQLDYEQAARMLGKPSPDAVRVATRRALSRLAEKMEELGRKDSHR